MFDDPQVDRVLEKLKSVAWKFARNEEEREDAFADLRMAFLARYRVRGDQTDSYWVRAAVNAKIDQIRYEGRHSPAAFSIQCYTGEWAGEHDMDYEEKPGLSVIEGGFDDVDLEVSLEQVKPGMARLAGVIVQGATYGARGASTGQTDSIEAATLERVCGLPRHILERDVSRLKSALRLITGLEGDTPC
jgi:hypothetical protein